MLRYLFCLLSLPLLSFSAVELRQVEFDQSRSDWNVILIQISAERDDTDEDYDNNIKIVPHISYQDTQTEELLYFRTSAEVLTLEHGSTATIPFILPGPIVEKHRLRAAPYAYYIEISEDGEVLPFVPEFVSANIRNNPEAIRSLKERCEGAEGRANDGILRPFYVNPGVLTGNIRDLPVFRRPEGFPVD